VIRSAPSRAGDAVCGLPQGGATALAQGKVVGVLEGNRIQERGKLGHALLE
jgi:hypothetical protein